MSIIPRPLKLVLGKLVPFSLEDKIPTFNLGSGTVSETKYLGTDADGNPVWKTVSGTGGSVNGYFPQGW